MLAGPLPVRSQSFFSQGSVSEYVEDSEPEREVRRTQEKTRRKKKRADLPVQPVAEVIELTDSEKSYRDPAPSSSRAKAKDKPFLVIDISDTSEGPLPDSACDPVQPATHQGTEQRFIEISSGLEDVTTDDSLPSIGKILNLPRRNPVASTSTNDEPAAALEQPTRQNTPALRSASPHSPARTDGGSDNDGGPLKLGRFAYAAPNPIRRTASKTPLPTEGGSLPPEPQAAGKVKRGASHRFADDFSDAQLSRILKCVSCDLEWTTRKTVPQKMKHVQACAKKNGLTDETVRILLLKELDNLPPVASSSKSADSEPAATPVPETLLEDVLKDANKKKPGRRPQVLQTVKSVTETRETILDKARALLQDNGTSRSSTPTAHSAAKPPSSAGVGEIPPPTQMFSRSNVATRVPLPANDPANTTQAFGPSRLAAYSSRLQGTVVRTGTEIAAQSDISPLTQVASGSGVGNSGVAHADDSPEDLPPSTQVLAASKFMNANGVTRTVVAAGADPLDEPISIHDTSDEELVKSSPARPTVPRSRSSLSPSPPRRSRPTSPVGGVRPPSPPPVARSPGRRWSPPPAGDAYAEGWRPPPLDPVDPDFGTREDDFDDRWNEWMQDAWNEDDQACLHYVPETDGAGPFQVDLRDEPPSPPRRRLATIPEDGLVASGSKDQALGSRPPAKKRARRKKAAGADSDAESSTGKALDIPQEEVNEKMKAAILKDEALHLRILRYEPIHFDVFLQMAVDLGIPEKPKAAFRGKVRAFLDQKAIDFYGADPSKSRTRRTRHP
ncbi:hypothetical protein BV20DRAFT_1047981 [Pilatotrama ljubarskyi]|nr:hypothetical protein BV20DRAFT_1047981 [Pilatotrama ljubarskyi]